MNTVFRLATFPLTVTLLLAIALSPEHARAATAVNLTEGQGTVANVNNPSWDGLSELVLIPGASLLTPSTTTALYIGFTGGSTVDVGNMVVYETPRNGSTVLKVTHVTLGGTGSPSIDLTSTSVCPVQPVSVSNPCIVRLDTLSLDMTTLDDYYFAIYFTLDTNNESITGVGQSAAPGALSGFHLYGDQTRIGKSGAIPIEENTDQAPFFLAYIMNE
jgi:hypothetical protein